MHMSSEYWVRRVLVTSGFVEILVSHVDLFPFFRSLFCPSVSIYSLCRDPSFLFLSVAFSILFIPNQLLTFVPVLSMSDSFWERNGAPRLIL